MLAGSCSILVLQSLQLALKETILALHTLDFGFQAFYGDLLLIALDLQGLIRVPSCSVLSPPVGLRPQYMILS